MPKKFDTNSLIKDRQQFEIVQRTKRTDVTGVKIEGWEVPFNNKSRSAIIDDPGLAHAIHDSSGQGGTGDVLVIPVEKPLTKGHTRTFVRPPLPWDKE